MDDRRLPDEEPRVGLVNWARLGRRVGGAALAHVAAGVVVVAAAPLVGFARGAAVAVVIGVFTVITVALVAAAALRGVRRSGQRLSGDDVGLVPPQVRRRSHDRREAS